MEFLENYPPRNCTTKERATQWRTLQWTQDFDVETLEARGHWATMEELSFHLPRYEQTVKTCQNDPGQVNPSDLTFATKFLATYLFIKVKGSRPMAYQYRTVEMVKASPAWLACDWLSVASGSLYSSWSSTGTGAVFSVITSSSITSSNLVWLLRAKRSGRYLAYLVFCDDFLDEIPSFQ